MALAGAQPQAAASRSVPAAALPWPEGQARLELLPTRALGRATAWTLRPGGTSGPRGEARGEGVAPAPRRPRLRAFSVFTRGGAEDKRKRKRKRKPGHHFLPLPHVSSQPATGLTLGGSLNYSYRKPEEQFNRAYVVAWSRVSTRGVQDHILQGRLRDLLGKGEVFQFGAWVSLDPVFPFYGINNHANLAGTEITGPYNRMRMDNYGGWFSYEHPLWKLRRPGRPVGVLRHYSGVFYYLDVLRAYEGSRLQVENPELIGSDRRGMLRGGLTWDSRDNDWSPQEGSLVDVTVDAAGPYTGSSSSWGRAHATARNYWPIRGSGFVFAHRVSFDALWGAPPLMTLGEFGGLFPMDAYGGALVGRGFARRRFTGKFKATASAEARFVPMELSFGSHHLGLGVEGFLEVGLTSMRLAELFNHWYPSGGPGLLMIWDRFVVFRVEAAYSREGSAIYLQSDHAF